MAISGILPYVQGILSILLIASILLQVSSATMGGAFGGDNFSAGYHTRRGFERTLFTASIVLAMLFAITAFIAFIIH
jgi:protein translocase SecG subunit